MTNLTSLQGDLLLDVWAAQQSLDADQLAFAIQTARVHGIPQEQIDAVLVAAPNQIKLF